MSIVTTVRAGVRLRACAVLTAVVCAGTMAACSPSEQPTAQAAANSGTPAAFTADEMARIDAAAAASLTDGATGTIIAIVDPQRGTYLKAYGTADTAGAPAAPDMHYRIASVTKTFTADAVLRLVDQGRVALADPISKYVPDIPNGDLVTVRDLLAMRSGLYDFTGDQAFFARYLADPTMPWTDADTLAIIRAHAAEATPPNQTTEYNNSNYVLLGLVIERATGQTVQDHLSGRIRELGLPATSYPTGDGLPAPFLRGYLGDGSSPAPAGGYRDVTAGNPAVGGAAGALISTVPDMARYAELLATGAGLSPATAAARQEWTPLSSSRVRLQYGLGVTQLGDWVGHDGSFFGYSNMVFHLPGQRATVVVAGNVADEIAVPSQALWGEIVKILYPDSLPSWPS